MIPDQPPYQLSALYWLLSNFVLAFFVPFVVVMASAWLFTKDFNVVRVVRDFGVCLYSGALLGGTLFDLHGHSIRSAYSLPGLWILFGLSWFFSLASLFAMQTAPEYTMEVGREKFLVSASLSTVGLAVIVVVMTRIHESLLGQ